MTESKLSITGLAGLVLCGGESKRMGTDKGLILKDDKPWFQRIGSLLESLRLPVYYSIRTTQFDSYKLHVDEQSLIFDDEISEGPLRGVLTAIKHIKAIGLLVVACDMPDIDIVVYELLLETYANNRNDFYAYKDGDFYHPFPGIFMRRGLEARPGAKSLQQLLKSGNTFALATPDSVQFRSYNQLP